MAPDSRRAAPVQLAPGEPVTWHLSLAGRAIRHLPVLTAVLGRLGQNGLGRSVSQPGGPSRRGRLQLYGVTLQAGRVSLQLYNGRTWRLPETCSPALYDQASSLLEPPLEQAGELSSICVRFETPLRLIHEGALLDAPSSLGASALASACYRRWAALSLCYAPDPPSTGALDAAYKQTQKLGRRVKIVERDLDLVERTRYSARQEKALHRKGLQGTVQLSGPPVHLRQLHQWLQAAEPLHLGKSTSAGFGHITVDV